MKLRVFFNVLLAASCAVVFCCVLGTKAFRAVGVDFPSWMEVDASSSQLEARNYQARPHLSLATVQDGSFQEQTEKWLSDSIPMRQSLLLSNAAIQRVGIRSANLLTRYDAIPTYYGSRLAYSSSTEALFNMPLGSIDSYAQYVGMYDSFAERHKDKLIYAYAVLASDFITGSPVGELMADPYDQNTFTDVFLSKTEGINVIDSRLSIDEYLEGFFKTDHHWNIDGAYLGYSRIATALGYGNSLVEKGSLTVFDKPPFYGSVARSARCFDSYDVMSDYAFDVSIDSVSLNGVEASMADLAHSDLYAREEWSPDFYAGRYAEFFHGDFGELRLTNEDADSDKTLLIVADSYSNCIERLFAKHYQTVFAFDMRHADRTLDDFLAEHGEVDDIVFLLSPLDFVSAATRAALAPEG